MIVLTIVCLVCLGSVQFWHSQHTRQTVYQTKHDIILAINTARTLSQSGNIPVMLCSPHKNWARGFRLVDGRNQKPCIKAPPIRIWEPKHTELVAVFWHGFSNNNELIFSQSPAYWAVNGRFHILVSGEESTQIIVNKIGSVQARA